MVKITAIALICGVITIYLKSINSEIFGLCVVASGIIILYLGIDYISSTFYVIKELATVGGINNELFSIIFKVTAIGYLVEFGADTVSELGLKGVADKLTLVGKLAIISVSLPVIYSVFNILKDTIQ